MLSKTKQPLQPYWGLFLLLAAWTMPSVWGGSFFSLDAPHSSDSAADSVLTGTQGLVSIEQPAAEPTRFDAAAPNSYCSPLCRTEQQTTETGKSRNPSGYFGTVFEEPFLIRGQSGDYWGTVQSQYTTPTFVAQSTDAASIAPSLGTPTTSTPPASTATSTTSIAPPLTDVNTSILNPTPAPEAKEGETFLNEPIGTMKRFWDSFSFNYTYVTRGNENTGLAIHEFDLAGRFALPCKCIPHANDNSATGYWYIAPSFGVNLLRGPGDSWNLFDLSLAAGARPQFSKDFGADLWVQVGIGSTCSHWCSEAIFVRGRGLGTLKINDQIDAIGGIIYYGRNQIKLLPSAGVTWKPNDGNLWYLVFPNPKLSRFIKKCNETDWWAYIQGDIGGGRWYVAEKEITDLVDYNDYRVSLGTTFNTPSSIAGSIEIGGAFGREIYAKNGWRYNPDSAFFVKGGIMY